MSLPKQWADEIDLYKKNVGKTMNLTRYTSTSLSKAIAIQFATSVKSDDVVPVIFQYHLAKGTKVGHNFFLNSGKFTLYPEEKEILLDDGHEFTVTSVDEDQIFNELKCTIVNMDIGNVS